MRILALSSMAAVILLISAQRPLQATCSRCIKIEEKRSKELAENPQEWIYYDDLNPTLTKPVQESPVKQDTISKGTNDGNQLKNETLDNQKRVSTTEQKEYLLLAQNGQKPPLAKNEVNFFDEIETTHNQNENPTNSSVDNSFNLPKPDSSPLPFSFNSYSALYTIFKTKNFLETLDGSFTLFLPTNEAFKNFPPVILQGFLEAQYRERLAALVSNHLVAKKLLPSDFVEYNEREVKAISGKNLTLASKNGTLYIDGIKILSVDPAGNNGIIYVIEKVLTP